jgi:hypothetical protein
MVSRSWTPALMTVCIMFVLATARGFKRMTATFPASFETDAARRLRPYGLTGPAEAGAAFSEAAASFGVEMFCFSSTENSR